MASKLLNRAQLEAAYVTYSTIFDSQLVNTPVIYPQITTVMPDVGPVTEFKWLGEVPTMTEWDGQRKINKLMAEGHTLRTRWYANGIELDYEDYAEDKLGLVRPRIEGLARMGPRKIDSLAVDYYIAGFAGTLGLCYDGQYLVDSDHTFSTKAGETTQSNVQAGALGSTTYNQAMQKMMEFVDDRGEPLEIVPDTLLAGPANHLVARKMLQQQFLSTGESNIDQGTSRLIINSRVVGAAANYWWLLALNFATRPVMVGVEFPPEFAALMGWDQRDQFFNRTGYAGAHMKIGLCYGHWAGVVGSTGA